MASHFLALSLTIWLSAYAWIFNGWYHQWLFWLILAPLSLINWKGLTHVLKKEKWWYLLAILLIWQGGRTHLESANLFATGGALDAAMVFLFALIIASTKRHKLLLRWILWGSLIATLGWSLLGFYAFGEHNLHSDRLRLIFVYKEGLNPVLTGFLSGLGLVLGAGIGKKIPRKWKRIEAAGAAILTLALFASSTRGGMLAVSLALIASGWGQWKALSGTWLGLIFGGAFYLVWEYFGGGSLYQLVERGAAGRWEIYKTYLAKPNSWQWLYGLGQAEPLPKKILGWFVHHPHSSWLTHLIHWGALGLLGLLFLLGKAAWNGIKQWPNREERWLFTWLTFGGAALTVDGAQILSLLSIPRLEPLLILTPAILLLSQEVKKNANFSQ